MDLCNNENINSKLMETCKAKENLKIRDESPKVPSRKQLKRLQVRALRL